MSFEQEERLIQLSRREQLLRAETLQLVSRRFLIAQELDADPNSTSATPYLQGFAAEMGDIPTIAFRMDSKTTYSVKTDNPDVSKNVKDRYKIFVPEAWANSGSGQDTDIFWLRAYGHNDERVRTYEVDTEGIRSFKPKTVLEAELDQLDQSDDTPTLFEFDFESLSEMTTAGIRQTVPMVRILRDFKYAMIDQGDFELRPWNS